MTQTRDPRSSTAVIARGRPRDQQIDERIVEHAAALLDELGCARFTMRGVAERACVPRSTVYARWAHASALLDELVARSLDRPTTSTGDRRADLVAMIEEDATWAGSPTGRAAARLLLDAIEPDDFRPGRTTAGLAGRATMYANCLGVDADDGTRRRPLRLLLPRGR